MTSSKNSPGESYGSTGATSLSLMERMKAREPEAWERFATLYGHIVLSMCRRAGLQGADRADVFQEVVLAVARHLAALRHDRPGDTFRGWLRTITRNKIRDYYRRRKGRPQARGGTDAQQQFLQVPELSEPSHPSGPEQSDSSLSRRALDLVRAEFENRTWEAFWRTAVDRQRPVDVADDLGMSLNAVYKAKSRVLRRLRRELGDLLE